MVVNIFGVIEFILCVLREKVEDRIVYEDLFGVDVYISVILRFEFVVFVSFGYGFISC